MKLFQFLKVSNKREPKKYENMTEKEKTLLMVWVLVFLIIFIVLAFVATMIYDHFVLGE